MPGYFDSAFNPYQGQPSAFTSPGMDPKMLAMLMSMQNGGGQMGQQPPMLGGPQIPSPQMSQGNGAPPPPGMQPPPQGGTVPGGMAQGQPGAQGSPMMQQLMQMDPNMLRALMARMGQQPQMQFPPQSAPAPQNFGR